jgi:MFS family permease
MAHALEGDPVETGGGKATFLSVLKNKGFRNLWLGQIISQIGDYFAFLAMMVVVSGFSTDEQTTTLTLSGMMIAAALPRLLFGMLAGVFVDRWDRRRTMIISDTLRAGFTLLMIPAFLTKNLPAMYALGFLMSSAGTLFNPAKGAIIPQLVPKDQLTSANSLSQTTMMLAVLGGPALGGLTLKLAGAGNEWIAFVVDSVSYVVSAVAIYLIVVPRGEAAGAKQPAASSVGPIRQVWQELKVGLKALFLNRAMATVTAVFGVAMLGVGAVNVLWIVYLKSAFGFDGPELAWRISLLDIGFAAGMIIASIIIGNYLSNLAPKWFVVGSLLGIGVSFMVFASWVNYWYVFAITLLMGIFVAPINTGIITLVQIVVPNSQLGRVTGGITTVTEAASIGSMSLAGLLGAALGIPLVFFLAGALCAVMGLVATALIPALTLKDKVEEAEPQGDGPPQDEPPASVEPEREMVASL